MYGQEIHIEIGFNILKQRRLKNLTQDQVAADAGISRSRLSAIEHGTASFTFVTLLKIAEALGVDFHVLLETKSNMHC